MRLKQSGGDIFGLFMIFGPVSVLFLLMFVVNIMEEPVFIAFYYGYNWLLRVLYIFNTICTLIIVGMHVYVGFEIYGQCSGRALRKQQAPWRGEICHLRIFGREDEGLDDGHSWFAFKNRYFLIDFGDPSYGQRNVDAVREAVEKSPRILWVNRFVWLVLSAHFSIVLPFIINFFYIQNNIRNNKSVREVMWMLKEYDVFKSREIVIVLIGTLLSAAFAVISVILSEKRIKLFYDCARRLVEENSTLQQMEELAKSKKKEKRLKLYYNLCPNCGAKADRRKTHCAYCSTSLEVQPSDNIRSGMAHYLVGSSVIDKNLKEMHLKNNRLKPQLKNCPACGAVLQGDGVVCSVCGTSLYKIDK
ncbi:MAG: zinc ribbon domain-containing protein [Saccharofermentans sp.]|nr:zinc ribbon domain-containing protein [Saccharofermentans sp.]